MDTTALEKEDPRVQGAQTRQVSRVRREMSDVGKVVRLCSL